MCHYLKFFPCCWQDWLFLKVDYACAGACGQLVVEQGGAGCGGSISNVSKATDIEELGMRMGNMTTAVA